MLLTLGLQGLLCEALWLYYDRYYLPLLPGFTELLIARLRLVPCTDYQSFL